VPANTYSLVDFERFASELGVRLLSSISTKRSLPGNFNASRTKLSNMFEYTSATHHRLLMSL